MERHRLDDLAAATSERNRSDVRQVRSAGPSGAAVRRPQVTDALTRTFLEEWARVGYGALSLDAVARRAGVGKAALYRRWRSKAHMAADLIAEVSTGLPARLAGEGRGSLEADLYALLRRGARLMRHPLVRRIMPDLYASLDREPALAAALRPSEVTRGAKVRAVIDRGVDRGELPAGLDRSLAADLLFGPLYWRLIVLGHRVDRAQLRALARSTAEALARLDEHASTKVVDDLGRFAEHGRG